MNMNGPEDRVEAYLDGTLTREERRAFERACASDPALSETVRLAKRVQGALHAMDTPRCPPEVTEAIFARVRRDPGEATQRRDWLTAWTNFWRPAVLAVSAIVLGVVLVRPWSDPPPPEYAAVEVDAALREVKWTLAYLNHVGSRTGETIREEVFAEGVVQPIERGLGLDDQSKR